MSEMAYSSKFVLSILVNGQPQKELGNGVVPLPWGAQYGIRLRNKHNRRALAKVYIDGENVSGGGWIVPAKDKIDILRPVDKDAAFKFVSLDSVDAQDFGKSDNQDKKKGVVEVRFHLEQEYTAYTPNPWQYTQPFSPTWHQGFGGPHKFYTSGTYGSVHLNDSAQCSSKSYTEIARGGTVKCCSAANYSGTIGGIAGGDAFLSSCQPTSGFITTDSHPTSSFYSCSSPSPTPTPPPLSEGCTVEGTITGQKFGQTYFREETDFVALRVVLQGFAGPVPEVKKPITDPVGFCTNCGAQRIAGANFCGQCGKRF